MDAYASIRHYLMFCWQSEICMMDQNNMVKVESGDMIRFFMCGRCARVESLPAPESLNFLQCIGADS